MSKTKILLVLSIFLIIYMYVVNITNIPENIVLISGEKLNIKTLWGINIKETQNSNPNIGSYQKEKIIQASGEIDESDMLDVGKINLNMNLFNNISLKDVTVNVIPKTKVIPLGNSIGLKLYTDGVLVVGMSDIEGIKPYENSGIEEGDRIISVDNIKLSSTEDLIKTVNKSNGNKLLVNYIKENNEEKQTTIIPAKTKDNEYKLGLWVRDAAARSRNSYIL